MHNCKAAGETLIALTLNPPDHTQSLPPELEACARCREEYASLRNALRVADQVKESALPAENFWPGYQLRLKQHLETAGVSSSASETRTSLRILLGNLFASSVRVPVPLAAALLLVLGVSLVFALNSRRPSSAAPPIVVTKTVEVPVIQERIQDRVVTRVVYRERDRQQTLSAKTGANAARQNKSAAETPISLVGFKPANAVNLTIIKGSYRDEK